MWKEMHIFCSFSPLSFLLKDRQECSTLAVASGLPQSTLHLRQVTATGPWLFSPNPSESPEEPPDSSSTGGRRLHRASATDAASPVSALAVH